MPVRKVLLDSVTGRHLERFGVAAAEMVANGAGRYTIVDSSDQHPHDVLGGTTDPTANRNLAAMWNIAPYDRCNAGDRTESNAN